MKYKKLGGTGLDVSVVGFGGIPIQRVTVEEVRKVILKAQEEGMNFIDTARGYSVSEEYIGEALEGNREKWIIATKSMARDFDGMKKDVETSLSNLRTDHIDLYQLHNVRTMEDYNKVIGKGGALEALVEAKKQGKVRHIGITSHSLDTLKVAMESGLFETMMYPYNIVETQATDVFKRAKELNIGVIAMKPMAGGALTDGRLAMRFILQNDDVTIAIPGMATVEEVMENAAAGKEAIQLTDDELHEVERIAEELGTTFCRRCGYCAPCTAGIDIPSMFVFQAYKERYNLGEWAEDRYYKMKTRAKDCIECGECEGRCPYDLPIRDMLKSVNKTFNE